ncbi:MAG: hypothetical protein QXN59_00810 [Candidatus Micrarchaeaceae archaeon]
MRLYFVVFCVILAALPAALANAQQQNCSLNISNSSTSVRLTSGCTSYSIYFQSGISQSKIYCYSPSVIVKSVLFGPNTYNDTVANCTFDGSPIIAYNHSYDNLLSPYGKYNIHFIGNSSNIALGYYFTFVPKNESGVPKYEGFLSIVPYALEEMSSGQINSQGDNLSQIIALSLKNKYKLPRYGYYAPTNSSGNITLPLEAQSISPSGNYSYNPYWLVDPFWGHDILTFKKFNITSNYIYTPTYIAPYNETEDIQLPDNTNVYWNFTIRKYSDPQSDYLKFVSGYQVDPNNTVMYVAYNVSNGTIRYDRGIQKPGIHEFIGVFKAPSIGEQDNSTTETYSVGISYCTYQMPAISIPGYYTFTYNGIYMLRTFWITNKLCPVALHIIDYNTVINCEGGSINSTNISIFLQSSQNVEFDNCRIFGNAVKAQNSNNIFINNSVFTADNNSNIALNLSDSSIFLNNDSFVGYQRISILNYSKVKNGSILVVPANQPNKTNAKTGTTTSFNQEPNPGYQYAIILSFIMIILSAYITYAAFARHIQRPNL